MKDASANCPQAFSRQAAGPDAARGPDAVWMGVSMGRIAAGPNPTSADVAPDDQQLFHLLDLVGPDIGRELLYQLIGDLGNVEKGLVQSHQQPDWQAIQGHSHVLISLAGAVGAANLQAEAERLNLIAHLTDRSAFEIRMPGILRQLAALIAKIQEVSSRHVGPSK